jgi:xylan 1,4-beta-xylosidase
LSFNRRSSFPAVFPAVFVVVLAAVVGFGCGGGKDNGTGAGGMGGIGGGTGGTPVGVSCSDPPPYTTGGTPAVTLAVDAASPGAAWSRFYEVAVATDHANTVLDTAWHRNIQAALKRGHDEAGFQYARFHGILDGDINVYTEDASGNAVYDWTRFDMVYDALVAAGMRAIVEIGLTPPAMASSTDPTMLINWYNNVPANISAPKDWVKWEAFMAAIVTHMEERYGADEIRNNWYYEVWNEPSWMYGGHDAGYPELYQHTVTGLLMGDPQVRVGGPSETAGGEPFLVPTLLSSAKANGVKVDFISYHHYGNDDVPGRPSDPSTMQTFHHKMVSLLQTNNFTGRLLNTEFGSTYRPGNIRDDESSASFLAKTIALLGTDTPDFPPPDSLAWWTISDLYEEFDTGPRTAYRDAGNGEGNFGLMLKGDVTIPASYDVAKPAFNAFRLLHMLGDTQLPVTGGAATDGTANAVATISADGNTVAVLLYNHTVGTAIVASQPDMVTLADPTQSAPVSLQVTNLPFAPTRILHYVVDHAHANSHTVWLAMGSPPIPTSDQWTQLRDAAELCYYTTTPDGSTSWSASFSQNNYSVSLILLQR